MDKELRSSLMVWEKRQGWFYIPRMDEKPGYPGA